MSDELEKQTASVPQPNHSPDAGMTNDQWAEKLLRIIQEPFPDESIPTDPFARSLISAALTYACLYSERPTDRFSKEHVFPGHPIEGWKQPERPGMVTLVCRRCQAGIDFLEINSNAALVLLMIERGVLPATPTSPIEESHAPGTN